MFAHNDPDDLEAVLRAALAHGQPRSRRPWKKVVIVVEGIYSMEGEMACLPEIVEIKKKRACSGGGGGGGVGVARRPAHVRWPTALTRCLAGHGLAHSCSS